MSESRILDVFDNMETYEYAKSRPMKITEKTISILEIIDEMKQQGEIDRLNKEYKKLYEENERQKGRIEQLEKQKKVNKNR